MVRHFFDGEGFVKNRNAEPPQEQTRTGGMGWGVIGRGVTRRYHLVRLGVPAASL